MNEMTYQINREPIARNTGKVLAVLSELHDDVYSKELYDRILDREEVGAVKYGVTMDRTDYTRKDWLIHLLEELLDGANYAMAADEPDMCLELLSDARRVLRLINEVD